uniref:Structural maintenance of chromosomes protein 4 n=1 Tax=Arcella intermedia TaxID=1963864 RepID=A0A6B2L6F1_9EUKA
MKDAKERVEQISNGIDEANQLVTKLEVANNACVSALEKAAKVKDKNNELIEELEKTLQQKSEEIDNLTHSAEEVEKQVAVLKGQFEEKAEEVKKLFGDLEEEKKKNTGNRSLEVDLQHQLEDVMKIVNENTARMADLDKKLKKLASLEGLAIDEDEVLELRIYDDEELEKRNVDELNTAIAALKQELTSMKPNMTAIKEYKQKSKECLEKQQVLDSVTAARDDKKKEYETLRRKRLEEFMAAFTLIRRKLSEMYKMITLDDGDADLEPNDNLDPFAEGISFRVRPPKKSWKYIHNLSGGEKTLSSLALVFALHAYKPNPIYIMDEIDAALDFKNVSIIANYIKERTKNAQFLIISLRNYMFELADRLVGIYKTNNCTKTISINPDDYAVGAT